MYDDAKLIELLKANDVLYNRDHPLAKTEHKKVVWEEIAEEMGLPVDRVIKRYRGLRDRFVRYKRSLLTKGPENNYDHATMEKMEFLTPFIYIKSNGGKITWEDSETSLCISSDPLKMRTSTMDYDISDEDNYNETRSPKRRSRSKRKKREESPFHSQDDEEYISPAKNRRTKEEKTNKTKSIGRPAKKTAATTDYTELHSVTRFDSSDDIDYNEDSDDAFCDAVKSFVTLCQSGEKLKENKALHGFCQMIIATISEMSIPKQSKAMTLVTQAVMEMKMEDLC